MSNPFEILGVEPMSVARESAMNEWVILALLTFMTVFMKRWNLK